MLGSGTGIAIIKLFCLIEIRKCTDATKNSSHCGEARCKDGREQVKEEWNYWISLSGNCSLALTTGRAWKPRVSPLSTPSTQSMISTYHSPLKGTRESTDSKAEAGKVRKEPRISFCARKEVLNSPKRDKRALKLGGSPTCKFGVTEHQNTQ